MCSYERVFSEIFGIYSFQVLKPIKNRLYAMVYVDKKHRRSDLYLNVLLARRLKHYLHFYK